MSIEPAPVTRMRFDEQPERLPPHHADAEVAVLGSVMLDRDVIGRVAAIVEPRDFYRERHGVIYAAMLALYEKSEPVDYLTLIGELERTEKLTAAGEAIFLGGLLAAVPTPIHAEHYAQLVADAATMRRLISVGGQIATIGFQNQHDPSTAIAKSEQLLLHVASRKAGSAHRSIATILAQYLEYLGQLGDGESVASAVPTGFSDLDRLLGGGPHRSDLVILAARPSIGKTALAMRIAANAAMRFGAGIGIFSLEMSGEQLVARLLASESGIHAARLRDGNLTEMDHRRLSIVVRPLAEASITIDDTPLLSVNEIRSRVRRMQAESPLDLVIIDHIQLLTSGAGAGRGVNRVQELSEISRQLKALAREENVAVLALSQLNRAVEQRSPKIPQLSDLRESGSIEQDADVVILMFREDHYDRESSRPGVTDLHIAKHRNGATGQVTLLFNSRTTCFLDLALEEQR